LTRSPGSDIKGVPHRHEASMTEVLFYHLEHQSLERALPALVERTLERNWRAVIQCGSEERVEALDTLLWTYREDSFLPHGTRRDGNLKQQPVFLTSADDNPNEATVRFLVDGAEFAQFGSYARIVYRFDGHDADAVERARQQWTTVKEAGCEVTYWQQSREGGWQKKL
jgi:DNA polymerase III subunit chi